MEMFYVSEYGDISIEHEKKLDEINVVLKTTLLSQGELVLVKQILKKYDIEDRDINNLENRSFMLKGGNMEDVHKFMKKTLKKDKATLTAIKYKDGRIELSEEIKEDAEKGVTVEKPHKGCPMPAVIQGEQRASKVLKEFLSDKQNSDFEKYRQFVSIGGYTGKPYLFTSRWCDKVEKVGQLYDIVEKRVVCANCLEILPSEEMLSLKLMIEFKEKEFIGIPIR